MSKFKEGDRVVTVSLRPFANYQVGSKAVVLATDGTYIQLKMNSGNGQSCKEEHIEHELVYNSPLYKALA